MKRFVKAFMEFIDNDYNAINHRIRYKKRFFSAGKRSKIKLGAKGKAFKTIRAIRDSEISLNSRFKRQKEILVSPNCGGRKICVK